MTARRAAGALLALVTAELALIVITGGASLLAPLGLAPVSGLAFAARAALWALLFALRFRVFVPPAQRIAPGALVLALLLMPTLVHFQLAGGRVNGDGISYYVFVHSLWKDHDFDLADDYDHYGMLSRGDLAMPTKTGYRRTIYAVGPAVVWAPFFGLGEAVARADRLLGGDPDLSGWGPYHRNAVALGSLLYGFFALVLIYALLRRHFSEATATGAVLLVWAGTFHYWYMVLQPTYAHAASAFFAALTITLWERGRGRSGALDMLLLGLVLGLGMCVRWQNGVFLILPGLDLLARLRREPARFARLVPLGAALGVGSVLGAVPQMLAWKAIYDFWILPYPPQGSGFVRLNHPWLLETLFSSRHGLISWTPVFWAGYLGFLPLFRRRPQLALPLALPLVLMSWVNMCVADYWGGGSYSGRRFDSLLPVFAFGFAASIDALRRLLRRRPQLGLAVLSAGFVTWNVALAASFDRGAIPRDDTVAFSTLARCAAERLGESVGFPTTWPASWLFALRHGRPPGQYDLIAGRYLFYMQNNLDGRIDLGGPDDEALLAEGWSAPAEVDGASARRIKGRARLFATLDVPEEIEIRIRCQAQGGQREIKVSVNGREAGRGTASASWSEVTVRVAAAFWQREINEVVLETGSSDVQVDAVVFVRSDSDARRWS
jgi:hypothetical protein